MADSSMEDLTDSERFFYDNLDDWCDRTAQAIELAAAEQLGFRAGVIFEWGENDGTWDSIRCDKVTARMGDVLLAEDWITGPGTDADRRFVEAEIVFDNRAYIIAHMDAEEAK